MGRREQEAVCRKGTAMCGQHTREQYGQQPILPVEKRPTSNKKRSKLQKTKKKRKREMRTQRRGKCERRNGTPAELPETEPELHCSQQLKGGAAEKAGQGPDRRPRAEERREKTKRTNPGRTEHRGAPGEGGASPSKASDGKATWSLTHKQWNKLMHAMHGNGGGESNGGRKGADRG